MKQVAVAVSLLNAAAAVTSSCQTACTSLVEAFSGRVRVENASASLDLWDAKQQEVEPACAVTPTTSDEVARVLSIVVENSCTFAVLSGGHAQKAGVSNSIGGVTIDLTGLRDIQPLGDRVRLGAGHNLTTAYTGLDQFNITSVLGHSGGVGVGGYTLGGGLSSRSHRYGLGLDNVYEYEVVLPNSTIVNVTVEQHPDLYWALRGAGLASNFGIVTHFTYLAVPKQPMLGGVLEFSEELVDDVLEVLQDLATGPASEELDGSYYYRFGYQAESDSFSMGVTQNYIGAQSVNVSMFQPLNQLPYESNTLEVNSELYHAMEEASFTPDGNRNLFGTVTYRFSLEVDHAIMQVLREEVQAIASVPDISPNMVVQPLYRNYFPFMSERGGNCLGLESEEGPLSLALFTVAYSDAADDDAVSAYMDRMVQRSHEAVAAHNASVPYIHINYAFFNQDVFAGYGEENYERLKSIQREVDPNGIVTSEGLANSGFKVL